LLEQDFESADAAIPSGYGEGVYEGLRYAITVRKSRDGKRTACSRERSRAATSSASTFTAEVGDDSLRPCEMPAENVVAFVLGYLPTFRKLEQDCAVSCDVCVAAR